MKHLRVYIATAYSNKAQHNRLRNLLEARGHELTHDWTVTPPWTRLGERAADGIRELGAVRSADVVVVLLPGGVGTHTELGYALGRRVRVVVWDETGEAFQSVEPSACPFYLGPSVVRASGPLEDLVGLVEAEA